MYIGRYINKHVQFEETNYTLILEDNDGILPTVRVEKTFSTDPNLLDNEFLYQEAKKEILILLNKHIEQKEEIPIPTSADEL